MVTRDKAWMWLANRLPRSLVYWAAIRLMAHATTGKWGHLNTPGTTVEDALKRWEQ